jgi:phosphoglycolate phosphatase
MLIKNIIFDLDGTLIDSSNGVVDAVNFALRTLGDSELPHDIICSYIGYPLNDMFAEVSKKPVGELYRQFQIRAADTVVASAVPLDGAEQVLKELHGLGYSMAIATTKTRPHLDGIVKKLNWGKYLQTTISGSDVEKPKPDPAIFRLALRQLNCSNESALAVGDTINDVLAAKSVPVKIASVLSPYGGSEKVAALKPDFELSSISELPGLLLNQNNEK